MTTRDDTSRTTHRRSRRRDSGWPLPVSPGARIGDYLIESVIAQGGFGTVYQVINESTGTRAALKVLHPDLVHGVALPRFEREASVVNQIGHPAMVRIHEFGQLEGEIPYFIMELVGGDDLSTLIQRHRRLPPADVAAIVRPVAEALAAAHAIGVVHRDVKASNVRLDPARALSPVVLLDFGVAKLTDAIGPGLTSTRQTVGSACSNAPEQIEGGVIDARTDVYGLAVLAFHMLTGRQPFASESPTVTQFCHLLAPRPLVSTRAGIAPAIDAVVARGMAIDPAQRFPGTIELSDAFAAAVAEDHRIRALPARRQSIIAITVNVEPVLDLDESLLRQIEMIRALCTDRLHIAGYALVREFDRGAVYLRGLADDPAISRRERAQAVRDADELAREVVAEEGPDLRFHVGIRLGEADLVGGQLWAGSALEPLDEPLAVDGSVIADSAVFDGLGLATDPVDGVRAGHVRLRRSF